MTREATELLLTHIAQLMGATSDSMLKVAALENSLKDRYPEQYEAYKEALDALKQKDAFAINVQAFSTLQEKLRQD